MLLFAHFHYESAIIYKAGAAALFSFFHDAVALIAPPLWCDRPRFVCSQHWANTDYSSWSKWTQTTTTTTKAQHSTATADCVARLDEAPVVPVVAVERLSGRVPRLGLVRRRPRSRSGPDQPAHGSDRRRTKEESCVSSLRADTPGRRRDRRRRRGPGVHGRSLALHRVY